MSSRFAHPCLRASWPGEGSCTVEFNAGVQENGEILGRTYNRSMIFEPALGGDDSRCSCETIDRLGEKMLAEKNDDYAGI